MPVQVVTALIALSGIIISVLVSQITSQRQIKLELHRLREDANRAFGSKLYEKRLEVYPELYRYISDFIKLIYEGAITKTTVTQLHKHFQEWDSANGIYFTAATHKICRDVRHHFDALAKKSNKELTEMFSSIEAQEALRQELQRVELALKYELAILAFESPLDIHDNLPQDNYAALHTAALVRKK